MTCSSTLVRPCPWPGAARGANTARIPVGPQLEAVSSCRPHICFSGGRSEGAPPWLPHPSPSYLWFTLCFLLEAPACPPPLDILGGLSARQTIWARIIGICGSVKRGLRCKATLPARSPIRERLGSHDHLCTCQILPDLSLFFAGVCKRYYTYLSSHPCSVILPDIPSRCSVAGRITQN